MAFDGITLHTIVSEFQTTLINGKVNKIYEPNSNNLVISIYNKHTYMLNIDTTANNYSMYLSTHLKENPFNAPNFCMTLRKYLTSAIIKKIYMKGLERICYIEFECYNEMSDLVKRTLIIELMGKYSNVILLNEKGVIIDALKKFDSENNFRDIMPARKYIEPQITKLDFTTSTFDEFENTVLSSDYKTLETAIPNIYNGICKLFIQSAIEALHLANTIANRSLKDIYNYINIILHGNSKLNNFKNNYSVYPYLISDMEDGTIDIQNKLFAVPSDTNPSCNNSSDNANNVALNSTLNFSLDNNFYLDDFYYKKQNIENYTQYRNSLLKILNSTLDKILKKMDNINLKIDSCKNLNLYKVYGELLTANIYRFKDLKTYENMTEVELFNYYDNTNVKIPIDPTISITKNAENYFKKYNKMKSTLEIVNIQKKETNKELDYLESLIQEMDNCENINDVDEVYNEISDNILFSDISIKNKRGTKKDKKTDMSSSLSNYIKLKIDEFDVFIGKNNKQNDFLTLKVANDNDYWFHTKDIHGSHLILKCNGITPKISTIEKCAKICAYYSKAKFSSHVPVDYTLKKFVKKPHGAVPGYVIYTNNKTIYVDPSQFI